MENADIKHLDSRKVYLAFESIVSIFLQIVFYYNNRAIGYLSIFNMFTIASFLFILWHLHTIIVGTKTIGTIVDIKTVVKAHPKVGNRRYHNITISYENENNKEIIVPINNNIIYGDNVDIGYKFEIIRVGERVYLCDLIKNVITAYIVFIASMIILAVNYII